VEKRSIEPLKTLWFLFAVGFYLWAITSAGFSQRPAESLRAAVDWIRFPLFALGLYSIVRHDEKLLSVLMWSSVAATLSMAGSLFLEKIQNPGSLLLYGTWQQSTKAGWFLAGIGLPAAIWLLIYYRKMGPAILLTLGFLITLLFASFLSGQIYKTLSIVFALGLFFLMSRVFFKLALVLAALGTASIGYVLSFDKWLYVRYVELLPTRLPWKESSDYYLAWSTGIQQGLNNLLTGIGPRNYKEVCLQNAELTLGTPLPEGFKCNAHPHQLYIQYFAETGLIGLLLFVACVITVLAIITKQYFQNGAGLLTVAALALIVSVLWPISTFSEAFGQHANFFFWYAVAVALIFSHCGLAPPRKSLEARSE